MNPFSPQPSLSYWDGLRISLLRFLEGPPIGRHGIFHGVVFTAFLLIKGEVTVVKDKHTAHARNGQWLLCQPGERFQAFSDSAHILSIHLLIENPSNAAVWSGMPVVTIPADRQLESHTRQMRDTAILCRQRATGKLSPQSEPSTFAEMIALQEKTAAFFGRLLMLLENAGMRYEAPLIRDSRVRETRQRLASARLTEPFARTPLAESCGLSAAQLDRLWRNELGMTPAQYWNRRRLETACALLQGDSHSVKQVAYETGFGQPSQFSFWFTKNMKESPRTFRSRHERD